MKSSLYKLLPLACLLVSTPLFAQVPPLQPLNCDVRYDVAFNGMPLGRVRIGYHESTFHYSLALDSETHGFAALVDSVHAKLGAEGSVRDGKYVPGHYDTNGEKQRHSTITYGPDGTIATRTRIPEDDVKWRKPVPPEQYADAVDPASAFFILRQRLHDAMETGGKEATVRTYDAARLDDFTMKAVSPADQTVMDKPMHVINTVISRKPIAGLTPKEQKKYDEGDPIVHMYISADGRFLPVKGEANLHWGVLSAEMTEYKEVK